jgi:aminoglycoside phosphotransferase (APT) family kinase protein
MDAANELVTYLQGEADRLALDRKAPIHKDFHCQHVLVNGRLSVIVFDELRLGDSSFDLAHFCANLHLLAYRTPSLGERLPQLQQTFLDAYRRHTGWSTDHSFVYFFIYTYVKLAKQRCTQRAPIHARSLPNRSARSP